MKKNRFLTRMTALLLVLVCMLGLLPTAALAADAPSSIKLEDCTHNGVHYESPSLGTCWLHQMTFDYNQKSTIGFCAEHGKGMGWSLEGQTWGNPKPITDPTVQTMMAYYYAHTTGVFTDQAHALGVDEVWGSDYSWTMNAWVQAIIWRYQAGLLTDPATACAEELVCVYNNLHHGNYSGVDDLLDGMSFRDRAQYILDLGKQGVWGDCTVHEYAYTGSSTSSHQAKDVQAIMIGELNVIREKYDLTVKKVDATNPNKGLPGARFIVRSENGTYEKEVVTGSDGTYTLSGLDASTYSVVELEAPEGYEIDNAGPQYVALPNGGSNTVTVTFLDSPEITSEGSIRKVDADDPTKGLAGAVIKIEGTDNSFVGTYTTGAGGYLADVPWDALPIGSFTATEVTPPEGYSLSPDPDKVKQEFYWDGKNDVALVFENDARVKVKLVKYDDSGDPLPGAVFNIVRDGQIIGTEATQADGSITVPNVTEGMYAFVEVSAPAPFACLTDPVIVHVDQATVEGGGTITVEAADKKLPSLSILKRDEQTKEVIPGTVFEVRGIHSGYHTDVTTGEDGRATLSHIPVDSYELTEKSVPDPYVVGDEPIQTVYLGPGEERELIFDNLKQPLLTIAKVDAADSTTPIPGTTFTIEGIDSDYRNDVTTGEDGTVSLRVAPGSYKVIEQSVPAPYYLPDKDADREQTVSLNAGDEKRLVFENHKAPELTIYKEDSVAGAPVEGARFHVTYTSNGEASDAPATIDYGEILTDANGEIKLHEQGKRLYPGEFTITEVEPAPGFQMKEPTTQTIILHGGESKTVTFQNEPLNAIVVEKYDSVTHEALPGCTFQLKYLGGVSGTGGTTIGQKVTGRNGTAIWTGLKSGAYIVEEVDPADGYSIINASETVYLADSGEQSVVTVRFDNAPDGILLIRKVCATNPSVTLPNAEFKVMYADGTLIGDSNGVYRTDENGEIRIPGLKPGKSVVVTETRAPDGFILDTQSQTVQIKEGRTVSLTFKNQPKGALIIQKRDSATGQPLPGAEFRVTTAAGCEVGLDGVIGTSTLTQNGIFTTDAQGEIKITNLAPGAYVLTEIKAPHGYVMDAPSTNVVIGEGVDTQTVVITNTPKGGLVINKLDSVTHEPLEGGEFTITEADGTVVDDNGGMTSSMGLYRTDENGQIIIDGLVGTFIITETKTIEGYTIHEETRTQTVVINPNDTQTITVYNDPVGGLELIKVNADDTKERIPNTTFEIRRMDDALVGTVTTDRNGRVFLSLENGSYYAVETESAEGFHMDDTPHYFEVENGETTTLQVENTPVSAILIHKTDSTTGEGIYGVPFILYDSTNTPVGQYTSNNEGYVLIEGLEAGRYYLRELENEGYVPDTEKKTVYVESGETTEVEWENTPITGQIQITKTSADYNSVNGWPAGTPIPGTEFEIYNARTGNLVDTVETDKNGVASSRPLPLGRYKIVESKAADFYGLDKTPIEVEIEFAGQIVKAAMTNKSLYTNVSIQKTGYVEVMPGQQIRYDFSGIGNNSTTSLTSFFWRDTLPGQAVRLDKIVTGTYNVPGNYKVVYKTNLSGGTWRTLADNLSTQQNYVLDASKAALGLASNEYVTEFMVSFGVVPANFRQVEAPQVYATVYAWLTGGSQFVNQADVGGVYNGQWIMATSRWVTKVYKPSEPLPRTGY